MLDLEIWLIGTPAELDAAACALVGIGTVIDRGQRTALAGSDTGRWRTGLDDETDYVCDNGACFT
jgi:hypothetical protein